MAYQDPYTGQIIGGGLMSPYTTYADQYSQAVQGLPTQADVVAQGLPSTYGGAGAGMMSAAPTGGAQMSPEAQARAQAALGQRAQSMALGAGKRAAMAGLAGADLGQALGAGLQGAVTPSSIANLATEPAYAAYGVAPETTFGKVVGTGARLAGGLLGGPFGAVVGAIGASPFASAVEDAMDMRPAEVDKDVMEDVHGFFGGRSKVADALTGQKDISGTYADAKSFADAANKAVDKLGTDYGYSRDKSLTGLTEAGRRSYQKQAIADINAYQRAQLAAKQAKAISDFQKSKFGGGSQGSGMGPGGDSRSGGFGGAGTGSHSGFGGGGGSGMGSPGSESGRGK